MTRRSYGLAILAALTLSGCVAPAPDAGAFRQNARGAVDSGITQTSTAAVVVRGLLAGRVTGPFADVVLTDAERAVGPIEDSFGAPQPPDRAADPLRTRVLGLLDDSGDAIAAARIAGRRDDRAGLHRALGDLDRTLGGLQRVKADLG